MSKAFLLALAENTMFLWRLILSIPTSNMWHTLVRLILFPAIWAALFALTLMHFFFFFIDELLFASYRKVKISKPIFIVGIPRSGTTWLQRVLANDKNLTTLTLTEALLAPSITQRYIAHGLGHLIKPIGKMLNKLPFQPMRRFDAVHKIRLSEPEEDFLLLLPLHACFLLTVLCPKQTCYWRLSKFDEQEEPTTKKVVLRFYQLCLQKHLYFHGKHLKLLSKNPSFTPFILSLRSTFEDANIVACTRPPLETVPSQLASLAPSQAIFGLGIPQQDFVKKMMDVLLGYYEILSKQAANLPVVSMQDLQSDLERTVKKLYSSFDMVLSAEFDLKLQSLTSKGKTYKSQHRYDLSNFGLSKDDVRSVFSDYLPADPNPS